MSQDANVCKRMEHSTIEQDQTLIVQLQKGLSIHGLTTHDKEMCTQPQGGTAQRLVVANKQ